MAYAPTSLKNFLNEDMGSLKQISDMPKEWKTKLIKNYRAGMNSEITSLDDISDPKKLQKFLKDENKIATILKVDGKTKYYIEKISPQKFNVMDADEEGSIRIPRRKALEAERDAQWKKQEEERQARYAAANPSKSTTESVSNPPKVDEVLNERRGGRGQWHDPANVGEYNAGGLIDFIKKLTDAGKKVEILNIYRDKPREKKSSERSKIRNDYDPLEVDAGSSYQRHASPSQKKRFEKYEEKKRAEIDKKIDIETEKLKEQIISNFDKAIDDIVQQMRRGYATIDAKTIGEKILSGVNLDGMKRFAAAYEVIGNQYRDIKPSETIQKLKQLGFGPKKVHESLLEDFSLEHADEVTQLLWEVVEKLVTVYGYEELEAKYLLLVASNNVLEVLIKLNKPVDFIAGFLAQDLPLNKELKKYMESQEKAESEYAEMLKKNSPKDYSKMDKFEIQKEIDQALDNNDYETLEKLKDYIPESLKESIQTLLNELDESILMHQNVQLLDSAEKTDEEDIDEGVNPEIVHFLEGVYTELVDEFEMEEEEASDFISIVHDELKDAFEDGLMPEEAAALVYNNEEALEKLAQMDPGYVKDFPSEEPPKPIQTNIQRRPNIY
jgi:hypothetical protein